MLAQAFVIGREHQNGKARMAYISKAVVVKFAIARVLCPCWLGEDPTKATCDTLVGLAFRQGRSEGD